MGCGTSPAHATGDAVRNAAELKAGVEIPRIVGPVQLYDCGEELPPHADIAYAGSAHGQLPYGDVAVMVPDLEGE